MHITIIQDDGIVGVDGMFRAVDLSDLDPSYHAIHYDTVKATGHIEHDDDLEPRPPNIRFGAESWELRFKKFFERWMAAAPAAPPPETPEALIAAARAAKLAELQAGFDAALNAGFTSAALGSPHRYDSEPHNRENLLGAVLAGEDTLYTCDDLSGAAGAKRQRLHTPAQLLRVLRDGKAVKQALIAKLRSSREAVQAANMEGVATIAW